MGYNETQLKGTTMLTRYLESEVRRYAKHPVLWSIALGVTSAMLYKSYMDLLLDKLDTPS